jgi:hypothetical protein
MNEIEPGPVVSCPSCGARNRIAPHSAELRPICGRCKSPIAGSSGLRKRQTARNWIIAATVAVLAGTFVLFAAKPRGHMSVGDSMPIAAGRNTPSAPQFRYETPPLRGRNLSVTPTQPKGVWPSQLNRRLANGTLIRSGRLDGYGKLEINNGLSYDAAAKLVARLNDECVAYFYIAAGAVHSLAGVPDGNYRLLFAVGEDWDSQTELFSRASGVSEFDRPLAFETRQRNEGNFVYQEYSVMQLTLHPVPEGTARTHTISLDEFKKY